MSDEYVDRQILEPSPAPGGGCLSWFFGVIWDTASADKGSVLTGFNWFAALFGMMVPIPATMYNTWVSGIPFDGVGFTLKVLICGFLFGRVPVLSGCILMLVMMYAAWRIVSG